MLKPKHNAECPICHDTWRIDLRYAKLTIEERARIHTNGVLLVVCEDCYHKVIDWDSEEALEWSSPY